MPTEASTIPDIFRNLVHVNEHFPLLLKALTDLAHESDRFLWEYRGLCDHLREIEAEEDEDGDTFDLGIDEFPPSDTLEFLVGRAMQAIRKATTKEEDQS